MTTFVLVHGAWQGASTWDLAANLLKNAGNQVYTPLLTGLGAHSHRLTPDVDLEVHIQDIVGFLRYEQLHEVVLVGHSYAGMIITGVAGHEKDRLKRLVYVDAFVPNDGQAAMHLLPPAIQQAFRAQAQSEGDGWRLKGSEQQLDLWGLKAGPARDFVRSKLCDFTLKCFEQPLQLPTNTAVQMPRSFIACVADDYPVRSVFEPFGRRAQLENWDYHELPTGHDCHVERPADFCEILLSG